MCLEQLCPPWECKRRKTGATQVKMVMSYGWAQTAPGLAPMMEHSAGRVKALTYFVVLPAVGVSMLNVFPKLFCGQYQRPKVRASPISAWGPALSLRRWCPCSILQLLCESASDQRPGEERALGLQPSTGPPPWFRLLLAMAGQRVPSLPLTFFTPVKWSLPSLPGLVPVDGLKK